MAAVCLSVTLCALTPAAAQSTSERIDAAIERGLEAIASQDRALDASVGSRAVGILFDVAFNGTDPAVENVTWLLDQQADDGGWGFGPDHPQTARYPDWTDLVNTQLAVAALRRASDAGQDVPAEAFDRAAAYCLAMQNDDGGWGYTPPGAKPLRVRGASHGSTTAAAIALLADCPPAATGDQRQAAHKAVDAGVKWLRDHYTLDGVPNWVWGADRQYHYYLYCLQHAATAGPRQLNAHVLRDEIVARLLASQADDGHWPAAGDLATEQRLALLALAAARTPILINRLDLFDNDPAGARNWVHFLQQHTQQRYAWQDLALPDDPASLDDAPILLLIVENQLAAPSQWRSRFGDFVANGGTIVTVVTDGGRAPDVARQLGDVLPHWDIVGQPEAFGLHSAVFDLPAEGRLANIIVIGNGSRPVAIVLPAEAFEPLAGRDDDAQAALQFMTNLAVVATNADPPIGRDPYDPRRGDGQFNVTGLLSVARIQYAGDWNVAPTAIPRLSDALAARLSIGVEELPPVDLGEPDLPQKLLWLTGTRRLQLLADQETTLKGWLEGGGTLLIDSAIGDEQFFLDVGSLCARLFGPEALQQLPPSHPLISGEFGGGLGDDLTDLHYTDTVTDPPSSAELYGMEVNGRLAVIVSRHGVTPALAETPAFGAKMFLPADARRVAINVLLYAASNPPAE